MKSGVVRILSVLNTALSPRYHRPKSKAERGSLDFTQPFTPFTHGADPLGDVNLRGPDNDDLITLLHLVK